MQIKFVPLLQSSAIGCGVASCLMAISAVRTDFSPTQDLEKEWVRQLRHMRGGIPTFELLRMIDFYKLEMNIWFETAETHLDFQDVLVSNYLKSISHFKDEGSIVRYESGKKIDMQLIISELDKKRPVLINGTLDGQLPHMRVAVGHNNASLYLADPLTREILIFDREAFEAYCSPPYGKWILSVNEKET